MMSNILDCRAVALEKKGHFFGIFEILEHSFLSEHSQTIFVQLSLQIFF